MAAPSDAAAKQRIIGHMNKDHQDSVCALAPDLASRTDLINLRSSVMLSTMARHHVSSLEMPLSKISH